MHMPTQPLNPEEPLDLNRHLGAIINTLTEGLLVVSTDGRIIMVNDSLERMTGYARRELLGRTCGILNCDACEKTREGQVGHWCRLFSEKSARPKRCVIQRKDGTYLDVIKNQSLLKNDRGLILGAVETLTDISQQVTLDRKVEQLSRLLDAGQGFHGMIGRSQVMLRTFDIIERAAGSDAPVLIHGESGTGKELAARAIHELGRRREGPYIQFNCAALNESLLESELFGHARGAFTGAYRHRQGRFEAAHGGDIFLDEIGDAPASIQVKLLRVLETKTIERVGEVKPLFVDVRVITATNKDLAGLVAEGGFRQDLYFRINVIPIRLPPLRERPEDIPLLTEYFLKRLAKKGHRGALSVTAEAMRVLVDHAWPGNVRELKSALEYGAVIASSGKIEPGCLPPTLSDPQRCPCPERAAPAGRGGDERQGLIEALRAADGNRSEAARILGVSRGTILNRMRKYGVEAKPTISF